MADGIWVCFDSHIWAACRKSGCYVTLHNHTGGSSACLSPWLLLETHQCCMFACCCVNHCYCPPLFFFRTLLQRNWRCFQQWLKAESRSLRFRTWLSSDWFGEGWCLDSAEGLRWQKCNYFRSYLFVHSRLGFVWPWPVAPTPAHTGPTGPAQVPFPPCLTGGPPRLPQRATHRDLIVSMGALLSRRKQL